jgi:hypothetical protein
VHLSTRHCWLSASGIRSRSPVLAPIRKTTKNGAVIRRLVGYERLSGVVAGQALAHLYRAARLHVNYFQPSFKLRSKEREGAKVRRAYEPPATPCERLLRHPSIDDQAKAKRRSQRAELDPVRLLHSIRQGQAALVALVSNDRSPQGPGRESFAEFLAQLPELWRSGEVRSTHRGSTPNPRHWRTRKDPFEAVWTEVLRWLQERPDITAGRLHRKLFSNKDFGKVVVVECRCQPFVFHADLLGVIVLEQAQGRATQAAEVGIRVAFPDA